MVRILKGGSWGGERTLIFGRCFSKALGSSRSRKACRRYDVDVVSDGAIHAGSRVHLVVLVEMLVWILLLWPRSRS